jgi:hypothetical protein
LATVVPAATAIPPAATVRPAGGSDSVGLVVLSVVLPTRRRLALVPRTGHPAQV